MSGAEADPPCACDGDTAVREAGFGALTWGQGGPLTQPSSPQQIPVPPVHGMQPQSDSAHGTLQAAVAGPLGLLPQ